MPVNAPLRFYFDLAWDQLASSGQCDSRGGREYVRVLQEWYAAGSPCDDLMAWIVNRANIGPQDYVGPPAGGDA